MKKIIVILALTVTVSYSFGQETILRFNKNGVFKIIQFTDLHHQLGSRGDGEQEFAIKEIIPRMLDMEKPDLAVFTGDVVTGKPQQEGWARVLKAIIERKIPYAVTLGNHDDEHDWTREQIGDYLEKQPCSLYKKGPKDITGYGNFVLELKSGDITNKKTVALLYFMDSNGYGESGGNRTWGAFDFNQVQWYLQTSRAFTKKNSGKPFPALAFFHIPLPEYMLLSEKEIPYYNKPVPPVPFTGERGEKECPGLNTGLFAAIQAAGDVMATFVGHDHRNNYIGCLDGVALTYGQFTGSHYQAAGARVIELKENKRGFDTWIRRVGKDVDPDGITRSMEYKVTYRDGAVTE